LADTHRCCALLVAELLKRCTHKDMTAEYRIVAAALQVKQLRRALLSLRPTVDAVCRLLRLFHRFSSFRSRSVSVCV
jgi:hypothetical protein